MEMGMMLPNDEFRDCFVCSRLWGQKVELRCITNCYKLKWSGSLVQQVNVPQVAVGDGDAVSCDMLISICHLFLADAVAVAVVVVAS